MSISPQPYHSNLQLVAPLRQFTREKIAAAGVKAAILGELMQAGFQVPPGFVIASQAYDLWIETIGLQANLHELLASMQIANLESVKDASQRIQ